MRSDLRRFRGNNECTRRDDVCWRRSPPLLICQHNAGRRAPVGVDSLRWEEWGSDTGMHTAETA